MNENKIKADGIKVDGHSGTWYVIDMDYIQGKRCFLLEHETYGDEVASVVIDGSNKVLCEDVYNGFDDYREMLEG